MSYFRRAANQEADGGQAAEEQLTFAGGPLLRIGAFRRSLDGGGRQTKRTRKTLRSWPTAWKRQFNNRPWAPATPQRNQPNFRGTKGRNLASRACKTGLSGASASRYFGKRENSPWRGGDGATARPKIKIPADADRPSIPGRKKAGGTFSFPNRGAGKSGKGQPITPILSQAR